MEHEVSDEERVTHPEALGEGSSFDSEIGDDELTSTPQAPSTPGEPEPGNLDAEPEPEPEPIEPPSEPPAEPVALEGMSEKEREQQQKKLDAEAKRHTERVAALLGDDAVDAILCPFCDPQLQGFLWPESLDHPRDEIHARMIEVLREPAKVEYLPDPNVERCSTCDGYGKTDTKSRVPGKDTKICDRCKGAGYFPPPGFGANGVVNIGEAQELVPAGHHEQVIEDADAWGSPRLMLDGQENPNYGKMPQYKNPDLP